MGSGGADFRTEEIYIEIHPNEEKIGLSAEDERTQNDSKEWSCGRMSRLPGRAMARNDFGVMKFAQDYLIREIGRVRLLRISPEKAELRRRLEEAQQDCTRSKG